ncbi:MAG: hypothetical protein DBX91_14085 [Subdoligranulum variabile]|uniref:hypothetical protein n=1 Tax=Gemmiger formicilis TaxID=745368 RepID=UPI000D7A2C30|nr:MAG: hypothetical protein DBX91_14085 [Subdoligranulum variabile]
MTSYVDFAQFSQFYGDQGLTADTFQPLAVQASRIVDSVTRYIIPQHGGLTAFPAWVQQAVRDAAAAQVLYYTQYGLESILTGQAGQGFTVGKVSVNGGATGNGGNGGNAAAQMLVSPQVRAILEQTGLMGRDVGCFDPYRNSYFGIW